MRWPWDVLADAMKASSVATQQVVGGYVEVGLHAIADAIREAKPEPAPMPPAFRCPDCKTDQPAEPIAILETAVGLANARKYACTMCAAVFCVGPQGTFRQHRDSLTYIAHDPLRARDNGSRQPQTEEEPERALPPGFKPRPTL